MVSNSRPAAVEVSTGCCSKLNVTPLPPRLSARGLAGRERPNRSSRHTVSPAASEELVGTSASAARPVRVPEAWLMRMRWAETPAAASALS